MLLRAVQPENVEAGIEVSDEGRLTLVRDLQSENMPSPRDVAFEGSATFTSPVFEKAEP